MNRSRLSNLARSATLVWLAWAGSAAAQSYGLNEITTEWVNRASQVAPQSADDVFGADISLYDQSVNFNVVDLSLPGNGPAVEVRRYFHVRDSRLVEEGGSPQGNGDVGELSDWSLDLPHLAGVFESTVGWQVDGPEPYARCSSKTMPKQVSVFNGPEYWSGNELHIPDRTTETLLLNAGGERPLPTNGQVYPWSTKSGWMISCTPSTANGYPGEAFVATSPEGVRYYLDWVVAAPYPQLVGYQVRTPSGEFKTAKIGRNKIYFLASKVVDRFGNQVSYSYVDGKLRSVVATDGRRIDLTYVNGLLSSISSIGRVYTSYQYGNGLSTALRADGSRWVYVRAGALEITHEVERETQTQQCGVQPTFGTDFTYEVTAPSGARGLFTFAKRRHTKMNVPEMCITWQRGSYAYPPGVSYVRFWRIPLASDEYSLISKKVSGVGVPEAIWTYGQTSSIGLLGGFGFHDDCIAEPDRCPLTKTIAVTGPSSYERYTYGIWWGINDGQLLKKEVGSDADHILRTDEYVYVSEEEAKTQPFGNTAGFELHPYVDKFSSYNRPLKSVTTTMQGTTFKTENLAFDQFARPTKVLKSSRPAQ